MIDVRCSATEHRHAGRCQLFAGHEGGHARLHLDRLANRVLHRWSLGTACTAREFGSDVPAQLPWAPGFPRVEGSDTQPPAEVQVYRFEPPRIESVASTPILPIRQLRDFPSAGDPAPA